MTLNMDNNSPAASGPINDLLTPLIPAALLVLFLFFIDEGWYSFRWMLEWGNWIVFVIYLVALYPLHWLISRFVFRSQRGVKKVVLVSIVGIPLTLGLLFGFVF